MRVGPTATLVATAERALRSERLLSRSDRSQQLSLSRHSQWHATLGIGPTSQLITSRVGLKPSRCQLGAAMFYLKLGRCNWSRSRARWQTTSALLFRVALQKNNSNNNNNSLN